MPLITAIGTAAVVGTPFTGNRRLPTSMSPVMLVIAIAVKSDGGPVILTLSET